LSTTTRFGLAEVVQGDAFELDAELFGDHLAASQDGDVLEHGLPAVAEARGLHRDALERAADLVDDERRERLALDVLGDHDERPARLGDLLEDREQILHVADLLLVDEKVRIVEHDFHALGIGHEVRARGSRGRTACPRRPRASSRGPWPPRP
jgi:hypothetical protein